MMSMQFLTMTVDLIMKFRVDPSSWNWFLTFLLKIVYNRYKTIVLASRRHQKWILNVFLYRTNPKWLDLKQSKQFLKHFGHFVDIVSFVDIVLTFLTSCNLLRHECYVKTWYVMLRHDIDWYDIMIWYHDMISW